jgi:hypothetical protein
MPDTNQNADPKTQTKHEVEAPDSHPLFNSPENQKRPQTAKGSLASRPFLSCKSVSPQGQNMFSDFKIQKSS